MRGLKTGVTKHLRVLSWMLLAAVVLGYIGEWIWPLSLLVHWQPVYVLVGAVLGLSFLLMRQRFPAFIAFVSMSLSILAVASSLLPVETPAADDGHILKVAAMNVLETNPNADQLYQFKDLDLLVVLEANGGWEATMDELRSYFPYQIRDFSVGPWSVAILSKYRMQPAAIGALPGEPNSTGYAEIHLPERSIRLFAVHFAPPISGEFFEHRDAYMDRLRRLFRHHNPDLVLGDLNLTPWSGRLRRWLSATGLRTAYAGQELGGTWPAGWGWFGLPLDHVLLGPGWHVQQLKRVSLPGSDHDGLEATLIYFPKY